MAGARPGTLSRQTYITNGAQLLYVLDLADQGEEAVVEDAASNEIFCMPSERLTGWYVVEPDRAT